jgi:hypothetical protein
MELSLTLRPTFLFFVPFKPASFTKMQSSSKRAAISKVHLFFTRMGIVRVLFITAIFVPSTQTLSKQMCDNN